MTEKELQKVQEDHTDWIIGTYAPTVHATGIQQDWCKMLRFVVYHNGDLTYEQQKEIQAHVGDDVPIMWDRMDPVELQKLAVEELKKSQQ
jgi:hypothetical protein